MIRNAAGTGWTCLFLALASIAVGQVPIPKPDPEPEPAGKPTRPKVLPVALPPRPVDDSRPKSVPSATLHPIVEQWLARTVKLKSLHAEFERTISDGVSATKESHERGTFRYFAPDRARLDISGQNAPALFFRLTGERWELDLSNTPAKRGTLAVTFPEFICGMKAATAKSRFQFTITSANDDTVRIRVRPTAQDELKSVSSIEVWLDRKPMLTRKLVLTEPNGNQLTLDFTKIAPDVDLPRRDFDRLVNNPR